MTLYNLSGIYVIRNIINDKVYVGSAKRFKDRKQSHFKSLMNNMHCNKKLQYSFNKHGKDAFVFEVIEILEYSKNIKIREDFLY